MRVMDIGAEMAWSINEEIWDICRLREGVYQGRVWVAWSEGARTCGTYLYRLPLTEIEVEIEGGHGRRRKLLARRIPGLPKRQRVLGSICTSSRVAGPEQWRQEVCIRGIETEPCRRRGVLVETVV